MSNPEGNDAIPASATASTSNMKKSQNWSQSSLRISEGPESQKGSFFLIPKKVTIAYGPYVVLGVMDYRTERLEGLKNALRKVGGEPILKPSYHVNQVRIWHLERLIFCCQITDLQHCGDGNMDSLCMEAAQALDKSARKAHFNLKNRYKVQQHLNARFPCPEVIEGTDNDDNSFQDTNGRDLDETQLLGKKDHCPRHRKREKVDFAPETPNEAVVVE